MHCFKHPESEATQLCGSCLKGLCPECQQATNKVDELVACSKYCSQRIQDNLMIHEKAKMIYGIGNQSKALYAFSPLGVGLGILGLIMTIMGFYSGYTHGYHQGEFYLILMGIVLSGACLFELIRRKRTGLRL